MSVLTVTLQEIDERLDALIEALAQGRAESYSQYLAIVGEIRGLRYARNAFKEIKDRLENEDD